MSKQWDGFNQEWLDKQKGQEQAKKQLQRIDNAILDHELLQVCIANGTHAKNEEELHMAIVEYIRLAYPDRFQFTHSDMSGFRVGIKARVKLGAMKHSRGFPDLVIYDHGRYQAAPGVTVRTLGMALEIKHQDARTKPYLKDGTLSTDIHIQEQAAWLAQFEKLGFMAYFVVGFEQARDKIDAYYTTGLPADTEHAGPGPMAK